MIVSGRYSGIFPESVKVSGILADLSSFVINVKAQKAKDIPLDKVIFQLLNLIISQLMSLMNPNDWVYILISSDLTRVNDNWE